MKWSDNSIIKNEKQSRADLTDICSTDGTIRVFMVDDSPSMLVLLGRILARDERVLIVGSATEGHKAFQSASLAHPDLVLMDLHMPGADGAEITRWLKQLQNPPIVLMVTSDDSTEARTRCLRAGADAFLIKGEDLVVQLRTTIQKFFGEHLDERQAGDLSEPVTANTEKKSEFRIL